MTPRFRGLLAVVGLAFLVGSCVDGNAPLDPTLGLRMSVPIQATIVPSASDAQADAINRIRAVAERVPDGFVLGSTVIDVSETADEWEVELELPVAGAGVTFVVYLELIHVDATGGEAVQFSGRTRPLPLVAGPVGGGNTSGGAVEVNVVRGPPANLFVTGVTVAGGDRTIPEGTSTDLSADVEMTGSGDQPTVFWTALDAQIVSLSETTITGESPGVGRIVASAGSVADTVTVTVTSVADSVNVTPDTVAVALRGDTAQFQAEVMDTQGQPFSDQGVTWSSLDTTIAMSLGAGAFSTHLPGTALIEARSTADTTIAATGVLVVPVPEIDVGITKTADLTSVNEGDTVTFTLTAISAGAGDAQQVVVTDLLPAEFGFVAANTATGTYDAVSGLWTLGDLVTGTNASLVLTTVVASGTRGQTLVNHATVHADSLQNDTNAVNDTSTAVVLVKSNEGDIRVTKTVGQPTPFEGDTITYTVTVSNLGAGAFTSATVADLLPTGLTFVSATPNVGGGSYDSATGLWAFVLDPLATVSLALKASVDLGTAGQTITNTAQLSSAVGALETDSTNNQDSVSVVPIAVGPAADIAITKTVDNPTPSEGDTINFTVTVTNLGPDTATTVIISDTPPGGLLLLNEVVSANGANIGGTQYQFDTLAVGDSGTIAIQVEVGTGTMGTSQVNSVSLVSHDQNDLNPGNNTSSATANVQGPPVDLQVLKSVSPLSPAEGDTVVYTVQVTNLGSQPATGVVVFDSIAAPGTVVQVSGAGTYSAPTGAWTIGTIAPATTAQIAISVEFALGSGGTAYTNTAFVQALNETDVNAANDTASVAVNISVLPVDIEVHKTVDNTLALLAQTLTYTVTARNIGANPASNIVVVDTIPGGLTVDSTTVTTGTLTNDTTWTIPTLVPGDSAVAHWYVTVGAGQIGNTLTNWAYQASVDQNDTNGSNGLDSVSVLVVPDTPPVVTITAPLDGDVYKPTDTISFVGTASDVEDGVLTGSISWASDQDGVIGTGASFTRFNLSPGPHILTASVTDSQGTTVADTIGITIAIISTAPTLNVPLAGTASLPISLSAAAPAGGITITVSSANPAIVSPQTAIVFIPGGAFSANAQLDGLIPGTANVSITSSGFGSSVSTVSVTAQLNIIQNSITVPAGFTQTFQVRLESQGTPIAAPAGGLPVTITSSDPTCAAAPATVTIPAGLIDVTDTVQYGGGAALSCAATLTATATAIQPDSVPVTVNNPPAISQTVGTVGAGLQLVKSGNVGISNHGGTTVRVTSTDSTRALVSVGSTTAGAPFVDIPLNNGTTFFTYYVHGMDGTTGAVPFVATAPGFVPDTTVMSIVQPGIILAGVSNTTTSLSPDDHFYAYIGIPSGNSVSVQNRRAGAPPLIATVVVSDTSVALLADSAMAGDTVTAEIVSGVYYTPTSVANGGMSVRPVSAGSVTLQASLPGFLQQVNATHTVTVSAPGSTLTGTVLGSGLQVSNNGFLGASSHGGVTVRLTSTDSSKLVLSPNATTPGTGYLDVVVNNGSTVVPYYAQGLEGQIGTVDVTLTAPGFVSDTATYNVVQPGIILTSLSTTTTSLNPDDHFYAYVGIPSGSSVGVQNIRAGGVPVTVTFATSDTTVGLLADSISRGDTLTATIPTGRYYTPTSVPAGGISFDPNGPGTTTVTATAPGFINQLNATRVVTVSAPTSTIGNTTVGAGLQISRSGSLGASSHGGVTVRVESTDSTVALIAPDASTPGTGYIDVPVADGSTYVGFYVQGMEGTTGAVPYTITAPGFVPDTATITVVQPGVILAGLSTTSTTLSPDDHFYAYVGIPSGNSVSVQNVRAGAAPLTATFASSQVSVGQLKDSVTSAATVTAQIPAGLYYTPNSVVNGGVSFDPVGPGSTNVSVSIPGYLQQVNATQSVSVSIPAITSSARTVGAGLQRSSSASLGASNHGGVTVRITSSNPAVMLVSPNSTTAGTPFVDVVVGNGSTTVPFYVQGVEGTTGATTVTISAPGFTDGTATITVQQPGVMIAGLSTSVTGGGADDHFYAYIGTISGSSVSVQNVRAGGTPLTVTIQSDNTAAGQITTTAVTGASVTAPITTGLYYTPGSVGAGGMAFRPIAAGSATVTVSIPGFVTVANGTRVVTVN